MDAIDVALTEAWEAMLARIERDSAERARRLARAGRVRERPVRAWCLAIRAGDTRIDDWGLSWSVDDDAQNWRPHDVAITGWDLRDLCAPVDIRWPGIRALKAAAVLGRTYENIAQWIEKGALESRRVDPRALDLGKGPMQQMVWTRAPIDPSGHLGRPPQPMWGTDWHDLADRVPPDWICSLRRTPVPHGPAGRRWRWVCPGRYFPAWGTPPVPARRPLRTNELADNAPIRTNATTTNPPTSRNGDPGASLQPSSPTHPSSFIIHPSTTHIPCGRIVRAVYLPTPCWTVPDFRGEREALGIPPAPWRHLTGQAPACDACWRLVRVTMTTSEGWNRFVSHITAGMLTGREVRRPEGAAPAARVYRYGPRRRDPLILARRREVRRMLLQGASHPQIASALQATLPAVREDVRWIYRDEGVRGRDELVRKWHGRPGAAGGNAAPNPRSLQASA